MMSHSDPTTINFHTVLHTGTQCYDPCEVALLIIMGLMEHNVDVTVLLWTPKE